MREAESFLDWRVPGQKDQRRARPFDLHCTTQPPAPRIIVEDAGQLSAARGRAGLVYATFAIKPSRRLAGTGTSGSTGFYSIGIMDF